MGLIFFEVSTNKFREEKSDYGKIQSANLIITVLKKIEMSEKHGIFWVHAIFRIKYGLSHEDMRNKSSYCRILTKTTFNTEQSEERAESSLENTIQ